MNYPSYWTNDHKWWYREIYLHSDHWETLRTEKLRITPYCENCKATSDLDIHHVNYRQLFDVQVSDLKTFCHKCHTKHHIVHGIPVRPKIALQKSQLLPLDMLVANKEKAVSKFENNVAHILSVIHNNGKMNDGCWKGLHNGVREVKKAVEDLQLGLY